MDSGQGTMSARSSLLVLYFVGSADAARTLGAGGVTALAVADDAVFAVIKRQARGFRRALFGVNDAGRVTAQLGHLVGGGVLRPIARPLAARLRDDDVILRDSALYFFAVLCGGQINVGYAACDAVCALFDVNIAFVMDLALVILKPHALRGSKRWNRLAGLFTRLVDDGLDVALRVEPLGFIV